jgi:hypothetical protein
MRKTCQMLLITKEEVLTFNNIELFVSDTKVIEQTFWIFHLHNYVTKIKNVHTLDNMPIGWGVSNSICALLVTSYNMLNMQMVFLNWLKTGKEMN